MPSVMIEVRKSYEPQIRSAIVDAVFAALVDAFKIPEDDKNVRLMTHDPNCFACPPSKKHPELYTHISIDCFHGRSLEAKKNLYRSIVERLTPLGIPRDHTKILLREIPTENWGLSGGQAGCDVDLGFEIRV